MNTEKPNKTLRGVLLRPLAVGTKAAILHQGKVTITSPVVDIESQTADEVHFETRNSRYHLLPSLQPAVRLFAVAQTA